MVGWFVVLNKGTEDMGSHVLRDCRWATRPGSPGERLVQKLRQLEEWGPESQ